MKLDRTVELYGAIERSCRGVVLGLFMSGVVQGVLMAILFIFTDLPDPIFIFFITVVAGMVPIVGSAPIWIGALVYHAFYDHWGFASVMLVGGLLVSTSDNIVRPLVMKGQAEMHPLLALVSVFGAVHLFGPTGIFLGPVIAAVFVSFLKILSLEMRRESIATAVIQPPTPTS
jgi:predicted PurR-regulated permease PerM